MYRRRLSSALSSPFPSGLYEDIALGLNWSGVSVEVHGLCDGKYSLVTCFGVTYTSTCSVGMIRSEVVPLASIRTCTRSSVVLGMSVVQVWVVKFVVAYPAHVCPRGRRYTEPSEYVLYGSFGSVSTCIVSISSRVSPIWRLCESIDPVLVVQACCRVAYVLV